MTCEKCFISTNILEGCNLTQHGSKRQIQMFMVRFTLRRNLSHVGHVKSVSSQPTFWKVVTWHNIVPKDKSKCSWLDSLWGKIFHLHDMWKVFHLNHHFGRFNLTHHGSKRQIRMFMVRFTLGRNLSLVWHATSV